MKKAVSSLCVLVIAVIATVGETVFAQAGTYEEECDLVFRKAIEEILSEEAITAETIKVTKEPVYDLALAQLGYVYIMEYEQKEGFALVINTEGMFDVSEFYMEGKNPYSEYGGENVYASLMFYLVYQDGEFFETSTGTVLNEEALVKLEEKAFYSAASSFDMFSEVVYYTNRSEVYFELAKRHPSYYPANVYNACAPAAGGNIIGYWTRFYPQLMPGFTPGSTLAQYYLYKEGPTESFPLIETLYNYMKTNVTAPGTTIEEFKTGMNRFVNEKGLKISYNTCMQNGSFNYNTTKQRLESGMPLVLFVDTFKVLTLANETNQETLFYLTSSACHAMAGFGYNEITYNLTDGQTRKDTYIAVATGLTEKLKGYFNINYTWQIDECYGINVYP